MCLKFSHKERNQGVYCRAESAKITGFNFELISGEAGSKSGWGKYPARTGLHAPSQDALRSGGSQSMSTTVGSPEQVEVAPFGIAGAREFHHRLGGRPIVRIHLLGSMRATTCLGDNILPHGKRARAVFGYLCLAAREHVPRARLAALLWDQVPGAAARTNLRQALRELSSAFGVFAKELISTERDSISLNVDACWIDALATTALDPSALHSRHSDLNPLCRGELLEELDGASASFDRWLLGERTR